MQNPVYTKYQHTGAGNVLKNRKLEIKGEE